MISSTYSRAINTNAVYCQNRRQVDTEEGPTSNKKVKPNKLKKGDVPMYIVENNLNTELELMSAALERRNLGDLVLYDYLISSRIVTRQQMLEDAWSFDNADKMIAVENVNCIKKLVGACGNTILLQRFMVSLCQRSTREKWY